jgi:hypothetical protein
LLDFAVDVGDVSHRRQCPRIEPGRVDRHSTLGEVLLREDKQFPALGGGPLHGAKQERRAHLSAEVRHDPERIGANPQLTDPKQ